MDLKCSSAVEISLSMKTHKPNYLEMAQACSSLLQSIGRQVLASLFEIHHQINGHQRPFLEAKGEGVKVIDADRT